MWQRSSASNSVPTSWLRLIGTRLNRELIVGRSAGDACCSDGILTSLTRPVPVIAILADELGDAERWWFKHRRPLPTRLSQRLCGSK